MKIGFEKIILFFILSTIIACSSQKEQHENSIDYDFSYLDRKINNWIAEEYYNGASVIIVKDNQIIHENYYGDHSKETVVHVASAGKWIAAAVIASVVDAGALSWDDPVNKYLPEFTDIKGDATLRQLLSHTAGYPDYQPSNVRKDDYQTLKESTEHIIYLPADTIPGTKFKYGGLSMQVAGRMAEIASGKDWETLFRENIAQPLRMEHAGFTPVREEGGFSPMLGGGFRTNVEDYLNFLKMIFNNGIFDGERILSEGSIREMQADQIKDALYGKPEYPENARQDLHHGIYGLGEWREEVDENGNATLISSPGWAGAYPWIDKKNNVYGFFLAKVNTEKANEAGFSSFYGSPVLAYLVRDVIDRANYPNTIKSGMIDIGDANLYYEETGEGDPLILIHGHSLDHKMWNDQFLEFAKEYRVIRYDLRGYGMSSPQREDRQFTHVDDLIKLMDELKIEKARIVGLSLGGYIGADMLGLYPDRMHSGVLASGNVRRSPKPSVPMSESEAQKREEEIAIVKKKGIEIMKREWFAGLMRSGGSRKERMRQSLWQMIAEWDAWQPLHKEPRVIAGDDAYDQLKKIRPVLPVMILEGRSEYNRFSENPEILNYLPNGRLEIIEDAGHMINMEQPEIFNRKVLDFMK